MGLATNPTTMTAFALEEQRAEGRQNQVMQKTDQKTGRIVEGSKREVPYSDAYSYECYDVPCGGLVRHHRRLQVSQIKSRL